MAGLTPTEAYTAMQGTAGGPMGLTSYDNSGDPETQYTHDGCLLLETAGGCTRSWGGQRDKPDALPGELLTFVVWLPVADFTAFPPPPVLDDPARALDHPTDEPPPGDEPARAEALPPAADATTPAA